MPRLLLWIALWVPLAASAAPSCPKTLLGFMAEFERSEAFQWAHTRFPLAQPQFREVHVLIDRRHVGRVPALSFPSRAVQQALPLERDISDMGFGITNVRLKRPDIDAHSVEFRFRRSNGCWQLVGVRDNSSL